MANAFNDRVLTGLLAITLLGGCSTPFAGDAGIDYGRRQVEGSITHTDPKLYKREALIQERRDEGVYLEGLLTESKGIQFKSDIIRELETITNFSAALGLRFDPTAAINYKRDLETSEIQQEIDVARLRLDLARLKREARDFRREVAEEQAEEDTPGEKEEETKDEPKKEDGGTPPKEGEDITSNLGTAATDRLTQAIAKLENAVSTRLNAETKAPRSVSGDIGVNPIDLFRDRATYRSLLNSARNAASLDELHDFDASALVRLYFSATSLPPQADYGKTVGILRMQVEPPKWTPEDEAKIYHSWLAYLNRSLNIVEQQKGSLETHLNLSLFGVVTRRDLYQPAYYRYAKREGQGNCYGLQLEAPYSLPGDECGVLTFAMPKFVGTPLLPDGSMTAFQAEKYLKFSSTDLRQIRESGSFSNLTLGRDSIGKCTVGNDDILSLHQKPVTLAQIISIAFYLDAMSPTAGDLEAQVGNLMGENQRHHVPQDSQLETAREAGNIVDGFLERAGAAGCSAKRADYIRIQVPLRFSEVIKKQEPRVSVYEVGPREQVQQISTTARAADAIALAASLSGQLPSSGVAADASAAYSRSAIGKADAIERFPLVVSFAEASGVRFQSAPLQQADRPPPDLPAFGWILGPKVQLDTKRKDVRLEQPLKAYDLSVDLSVPGWWPHLELRSETAWAPNWRTSAGRTMAPARGGRVVRVPLAPNSADMSALTRLLSEAPARIPTIKSWYPRTISACSTSVQLLLTGENIWRGTTVLIGGRKLGSGDVTIMPDMNGIIVSVSKEAFPAIERKQGNQRQVQVTVLTPYGPATAMVDVTDTNDEGGCKTKEPAPESDRAAQKPSITDGGPTEVSICSATVEFDFLGKNLRPVQSVKLAGVAAASDAVTVSEDGTALSARFDVGSMRPNLQNLPKAELIVRTSGGIVKREITIQGKDCKEESDDTAEGTAPAAAPVRPRQEGGNL